MERQRPAKFEVHEDAQGTLIVAPKTSPHRQTFIVLHGAGDSAKNFAPFLLLTPVGRFGASLRDAFPHARFVFPTAPPRLSVRYGQQVTRWFDFWSLENPDEREEVQELGLRESAARVRALVQAEAAQIPTSDGGEEKENASNVVLAGLSNGAGTSLASLSLLGPPFGDQLPVAAVVGMCGWLPYARKFKAMAEEGRSREDVRRWFAKEIGWTEEEVVAASAQKPLTPVFLGHGDDDWVVPLERMGEAEEGLRGLGFGVDSKVYPGLAHWYSEEMLEDIVEWLRERLPSVESSASSAQA